MAKKIAAVVKIQVPAGEAKPGPPVGPSLAPYGINIMEFVKQYNARTEDKKGTIIPVEITVYEDKTFTFITKMPPASDLLRKAAGVEKGSGKPNQQKVGRITREQLRQVAQIKMPDTTARDLDGAMRVLEGTARSMGIEIVD
ncbi:MAG: 50S ribosomal protein L11 [Armatimonadota bacterium]|nr:50S ribosomal protein L11 [Armatimonadota bacterium]